MALALIGLTTNVKEAENELGLLRTYPAAVVAAGGVPLLLSPDITGDVLEGCLDALDGLLLTGGVDLAPALYGQAPVEGLGEVTPSRDALELALARGAYRRSMPVLGICRGMQVMNVALGGTLYQDLPTQWPAQDTLLRHSRMDSLYAACHEAQVEPDTLLRACVAQEIVAVNSSHHQAVCEPGAGLKVVAHATDGVIEGVECPAQPFFVGVQWHPERLVNTQQHAVRLFQAFVNAAEAYKRAKGKAD